MQYILVECSFIHSCRRIIALLDGRGGYLFIVEMRMIYFCFCLKWLICLCNLYTSFLRWLFCIAINAKQKNWLPTKRSIIINDTRGRVGFNVPKYLK